MYILRRSHSPSSTFRLLAGREMESIFVYYMKRPRSLMMGEEGERKAVLQLKYLETANIHDSRNSW